MFESIGKTTAAVYACPLDAERHVRVEGEGTLPDYCDDIHRVIRLEAKAILSSRRVFVSEGKLVCEVSGNVIFGLIYQGEDGGEVMHPASHSFQEPFATAFEIPWNDELPEPYVLFCKARLTASGAKALSKKKASYSASVAVSARLCTNRPLNCLESPRQGVETLEKTLTLTSLAASCEETFSLEEEISLPTDAAGILTLLDCDVAARVQWVRPSAGQADFGVASELSFAYFSEAGEEQAHLCSFSQPMDISETLSLPEIAPTDRVELTLSPGPLKAEVLMDAYGARRALRVQLSYTVTAAVWRQEEVTFVEDAYCLQGDCEMQYESSALSRLIAQEHSETEETVEISLSEELRALEHAKARFLPESVRVEEEGLVLEGEWKLCGLGVRAEDGRLLSLEDSCKTRLCLKLPSQGRESGRGLFASAFCEVSVDSVRLSPSSAALRLSVGVSYTLWEQSEKAYVTSFSTSESAAENFCGLRFYYPSPSESLWEIAKEFCVPLQTLMRENGLNPDSPLPHMLLITK